MITMAGKNKKKGGGGRADLEDHVAKDADLGRLVLGLQRQVRLVPVAPHAVAPEGGALPVHGLLGEVPRLLSVGKQGVVVSWDGIVRGRSGLEEASGGAHSLSPSLPPSTPSLPPSLTHVLPPSPERDGCERLPLRRLEALEHLELDGEAVAVPPGHVAHLEAAEHLVAVDEVLQDLVERVPDVQVPVGVGRAVVQDELGACVVGELGSPVGGGGKG